MRLKQTLLALSLGGSALTSCSDMQNQPLNDTPPIQPAPITQSVQKQEVELQEEKIQYPSIHISQTVNAEKFQQNFISLLKSLENVDFGQNTEWKETTMSALYDLAQYEFGQHIIANAPAGISFNPTLSTNQNCPASYLDQDNCIYLNDYLYKAQDYNYITDILAHEITHSIQAAHGRTNDYLCSLEESVILNKLCEAEALSIGSVASSICNWKLNTPENISEFVNYDLIGWYKDNWKDFNEEDFKKTDPTYIFQQALKASGDIELAAKVTTGHIAKTYIQKNPREGALSWQKQYDETAINNVNILKDEQYFSGGNSELFKHNVQYYKDHYGLNDADVQTGLSQDMEVQLAKSMLEFQRKNGVEIGNSELKWQQQEAALFAFRVQAAQSVDEIRDSLYYFKYSKPEHSIEAQVLLESQNPVAQEALTQLTKEGYLKYDIDALMPKNSQQISALRTIKENYNLLIIRPQKKSFLDATNHPTASKNENIRQSINNVLLMKTAKNTTITMPEHTPTPSCFSGYVNLFRYKRSSR